MKQLMLLRIVLNPKPRQNRFPLRNLSKASWGGFDDSDENEGGVAVGVVRTYVCSKSINQQLSVDFPCILQLFAYSLQKI